MTRKLLSDEELDLLVVRALSRLPAHTPARGFADRVLARVQLPAALPVALARRSRAWLSEPRRVVHLAAAYSVAGAIALAFTLPRLVASVPEVRFAAEWLAAQLGSGVREALVATAGWAVSSGLSDAVGGVSLSDPVFWVGCFGVGAAYSACALGLQRVMRTPARGKDAPLRVTA